ncbi:hypothetical protein PMAYCL1PPCAC_05231, partial [Pristionchus mayeri]
SLLFSLSDPSNPQFDVVPSHHHKYQCPRYVHTEKTFRKTSDILSSIQISDPSDEIKELIFKLNNHRETISALKAHVLRSAYTEQVRRTII